MRMEGVADIALTRYGGFHARLTQVTLDHLRLFTVKENLPRIACFSVPKGDALIALSLGGGPAPIWGGVTAQPDNLITLGPGARAHMRTDGPSHWAAIWFPINDFARYSHALMGKVPTLPGIVCCWQPAANTGRSLRHILTDVMRAAQTRPDALTVAEAAHGLDQQLIHLLIEGLSGRPLDGNIPMRRRRHELMDQFEELLTSGLSGEADIAEIGGMLGVSDRFLRRCCEQQFGMSPLSYLRLRRLQLVHCILQSACPETLSVSQAARRHGFRHLGRFAAAYRDLFGEQPSATLRQGPGRAMPELALRAKPAN